MEQNAIVAVAAGAGPPSVKPPQTDRVIAALLGNPTLAAAAQALGIGTPTLWRIMKRRGFQARYREARRRVVSHAIGKVQEATSQAVETLRGVIGDGQAPIWARIFASKSVLDLAIKGMELEDFDARLTALEGALEAAHGAAHTAEVEAGQK